MGGLEKQPVCLLFLASLVLLEAMAVQRGLGIGTGRKFEFAHRLALHILHIGHGGSLPLRVLPHSNLRCIFTVRVA